MTAAPRPDPSAIGFLNRELSWLQFDARVLALAEDDATPLLERAKFAAIFATNLDEFFMVRVAGLRRLVEAGVTRRSVDGRTPTEELDAVLTAASRLAARHAACWRDAIAPRLDANGVRIAGWDAVGALGRRRLRERFVDRILPVLTPLAATEHGPMTAIGNRTLCVGTRIRRAPQAAATFAHVPVPANLPRFVDAGDGTLVPLEALIAAHLELLFPGMRPSAGHAFRVTRDAQLATDDDAVADLLRSMPAPAPAQSAAPAVRLEIESAAPPSMVRLLGGLLSLDAMAIHRLPAPLALGDAWELHRLDRPELREAPHLAAGHVSDASARHLVQRVREGEVLLHHPYESFSGSVQALIEQAAADPRVLAIKQTLYRTTADPIVNALVSAARAGKQVVVVVELKARFEEANNVAWTRMLERAGCHVVHGLPGLKTHAKLGLVVRREGRAVRQYVHVGTGNYNAATARAYEDVGLLSADPRLAADVAGVFNVLTGHARPHLAERLMVAPFDLRPRLLAAIHAQARAARRGRPARIVAKCNALTDPEVIEALCAASRVGVRVDLVVRGICMLRPGIAGHSDSVTVHSILGRFLEHSRIYRFGVGSEAETWMGSADLMERNLDRRVEVLVRVDAVAHRERLARVLALALGDPTAWRLGADGQWQPPHDTSAPGMQRILLAEAAEAGGARPAAGLEQVAG
ncbi:MAG: polyphosphate kinase 1 [Chloroflexota bacterium]